MLRSTGLPIPPRAVLVTALLFALAPGLVACGDEEPTGPARASQVVITQGPSDATVGEAISPAVEVQIQDEAGNLVPTATGPVTIELGTNPGGGAVLGGTTGVTADSGVATFSDLNIEVAASDYTLVASVSGVGSDVSGTFQITPGSATQLAFLPLPSDWEGQEPTAVEVEARDEFGNRVTGFSGDVSLVLEDDPTGGEVSLSGTTAVSASSGVATFGDLSLALPGDGFTLEATASGLTGVESGLFAVHLTFVQTSPGHSHTCGVTVADYAYCWGNNTSGQLGDGTTTDSSTPVPVDVSGLSTQTFARVSAGGSHYTCGVTTADEAFCWGSNAAGQLGDGSTTDSSTPVAVSTTEAFVQVTAGNNHTCGVTTGDEPFCWGGNFEGQLGDGSTTDSSTPVAVSTTEAFVQVTAGGRHTCGVTTADEPFCWGRNSEGQLGDGTTTDRSTPVAVSTTESFALVSAGGFQTCGVTTADEPFCWGANGFGQLGDGTTNSSSTPVAVSTAESFMQVSADGNHACGVTTADEPFCWGRNLTGQLGDGSTTDSSTPVAVSTAESFMQVSADGNHTCGVTTADETFCWGNNTSGQLGDGTTTNSSSPVLVVQ